jgi:hypothetical protein
LDHIAITLGELNVRRKEEADKPALLLFNEEYG